MAACGGDGPTTPSTTDRLPLRPGTFSLVMTGADLSNVPELPVCDQLFVPYDGKMVFVSVSLARSATGWTVKSSDPDALDLLLQFHQAGDATLPRLDFPVSGTIHGSAWDMALPFKRAYDVHMSIAGTNGARDASFEGSVEHSGSFASGTITGNIVFSDHQGAASHCSTIGWYLTPVA
jgi:hypothetical protein